MIKILTLTSSKEEILLVRTLSLKLSNTFYSFYQGKTLRVSHTLEERQINNK